MEQYIKKCGNTVMKNIKKLLKIVLVSVLTLSLQIIFIPKQVTLAGTVNDYVINEEMLKGDADSLLRWRTFLMEEENVSFSDGVIKFGRYFDNDNSLIAWKKVFTSPQVKETLTVSFDIKIADIKGDKKFGFVYGLETIVDEVGSNGSTFIYFSKENDKVGCSINFYDNGDELKLLPFTEIENNNKIKVKIFVLNDGTLKLYFDGEEIYASKSENIKTIPKGYIGFATLGTSIYYGNYVDIEIGKLIALNKYYDKPQNPLICKAYFENDEYNSNDWVINSTAVKGGNGLVVSNGALNYNWAGQNSAFANKHRYSNFELSYEIFGACNEKGIAPNGLPRLPSQWQSVAWGLDGSSALGVATNYITKSVIYFNCGVDLREKITVIEDGVEKEIDNPNLYERNGKTVFQFVYNGKYLANFAVPEKYAFLDREFDEETHVCVKIRMVDGVLSVYMKLLEEVNYTEIYRYVYQNSNVSTGYVVIRGEGNQYTANYSKYVQGSYYSLSKILLTNLDNNPNTINTTFVSNRKPIVEDVEYIDTYDDGYLLFNRRKRSK